MKSTEDACMALFRKLTYEEFQTIMEGIPRENWERWLAHKDEYYRLCQKQISYAIYHYASQTPMDPDDIRGQAYLYFCLACIRWDPNGEASLQTYVANQLKRIGGYLVRPESLHRNNVTRLETDKGTESILDYIGLPDPDGTLMEYVSRTGTDAVELLNALANWNPYTPISATALYRRKLLPWSLPRYQNALKGLKASLKAWKNGEDFMGYARLKKAGTITPLFLL